MCWSPTVVRTEFGPRIGRSGDHFGFFGQDPTGDHALGSARQGRRGLDEERREEIGCNRRRDRHRPRSQIHAPHVELDAVCNRVSARGLERRGIIVDGHDRLVAQPGRNERQHPGAAAEIEERTARGQREHQLEAHPGRGVCAGAERPSGIYDHIERGFGRRLPRRPDGQPAVDHQRPVELAPAVGPVVGHLFGKDLDQRVAGGGAQIRERRQFARRAVERVLDGGAVIDLLDAAGRQVQQLGQHQLGLLAPNANREPDHVADAAESAAERAPELPEHAFISTQIVVGHRLRQLFDQLALLTVQVAGDDHVHDDA